MEQNTDQRFTNAEALILGISFIYGKFLCLLSGLSYLESGPAYFFQIPRYIGRGALYFSISHAILAVVRSTFPYPALYWPWCALLFHIPRYIGRGALYFSISHAILAVVRSTFAK
jgi:hypothetical protein